MADHSKREARRETVRRGLETEPPAAVVRCRSCKKSQREVLAMIEMGGFVFCNECISAAYAIREGRKPRQ